jgi:rifampicin phosphotransferase
MIKSLINVAETETPVFGGKAANLGKLCRSGLRVPQGYAISSDITSDIVYRHGRFEVPGELLSANAEIAEAIRRAELDTALTDSLRSIRDELTADGSTVAVRSSCVYEDSEESSFAGIFASYTDLKTFDSILLAIKNCIASMYSDRALEFAILKELDLSSLRMGVIVQKYVPGTPSGVAFTVDSVNMDPRTTVVHMVDGPCSGFVDSTAESRMIRVDRDSCTIIGTNKKNVAGSSTLSITLIERLIPRCLEIERIMGSYQDIEWTLFDGEFYFVQARPITTYKTKIDHDAWDPGDGHSWSLSAYSRALLPLELEFKERCLTGCRTGAVETANRGVGPIYVSRCGYIYTRMEDIPDHAEQRRKWSEYISELVKEQKNVFEDVLLPELVSKQNELDRFVHHALDAHAIARFLEDGMSYAEWASMIHWKAVWGNCYLASCETVPTFVDEFSEELTRLDSHELEDLVYSPTVFSEMRRALISIASKVENEPVLKSLFDDCTSNNVISARIENMDVALPLLKEIDDLLETYWRYPCGSWRDPTGPIMLEQPEAIYGWIGLYRSTRIEDFDRTQREIRDHKSSLTRQIERTLVGEDVLRFRDALELVEKSYRCRDDHAHYLDNTYQAYIRVGARKAGKTLVQLGLLIDPRDVWFLRSDEIAAALREGTSSVTALINRRREEHKYNLSILAPSTIGPNENETDRISEDQLPTSEELTGISGLHTSIRGEVCVFSNERLDLRVPAIIVLPHERAINITSYLDRIEGIIVEQGSPYSHIGIIARELQIPTLFGVKGAMKALHDGDRIELDGISEIVRILSASDAIS